MNNEIKKDWIENEEVMYYLMTISMFLIGTVILIILFLNFTK